MDKASPHVWRRGNTWGGTLLCSIWSDRLREIPAARRAPLRRSELGSDMSHCVVLWLLKQVSLFLSTDFFLGRQTIGNKRRPFNSNPLKTPYFVASPSFCSCTQSCFLRLDLWVKSFIVITLWLHLHLWLDTAEEGEKMRLLIQKSISTYGTYCKLFPWREW